MRASGHREQLALRLFGLARLLSCPILAADNRLFAASFRSSRRHPSAQLYFPQSSIITQTEPYLRTRHTQSFPRVPTLVDQVFRAQWPRSVLVRGQPLALTPPSNWEGAVFPLRGVYTSRGLTRLPFPPLLPLLPPSLYPPAQQISGQELRRTRERLFRTKRASPRVFFVASLPVIRSSSLSFFVLRTSNPIPAGFHTNSCTRPTERQGRACLCARVVLTKVLHCKDILQKSIARHSTHRPSPWIVRLLLSLASFTRSPTSDSVSRGTARTGFLDVRGFARYGACE